MPTAGRRVVTGRATPSGAAGRGAVAVVVPGARRLGPPGLAGLVGRPAARSGRRRPPPPSPSPRPARRGRRRPAPAPAAPARQHELDAEPQRHAERLAEQGQAALADKLPFQPGRLPHRLTSLRARSQQPRCHQPPAAPPGARAAATAGTVAGQRSTCRLETGWLPAVRTRPSAAAWTPAKPGRPTRDERPGRQLAGSRAEALKWGDAYRGGACGRHPGGGRFEEGSVGRAWPAVRAASGGMRVEAHLPPIDSVRAGWSWLAIAGGHAVTIAGDAMPGIAQRVHLRMARWTTGRLAGWTRGPRRGGRAASRPARGPAGDRVDAAVGVASGRARAGARRDRSSRRARMPG